MTKQHIPYRGKDEIYFRILTAIKENEGTVMVNSPNSKTIGRIGRARTNKGIHLTRLMFEAGLANTQLKQYLNKLLANGLITCDLSTGRPVAASSYRKASIRGQTFHATERGLKYLDMITEMKESIPGVKI